MTFSIQNIGWVGVLALGACLQVHGDVGPTPAPHSESHHVLAYGFKTQDGGGLAGLNVNPATGAIDNHRVLFSSPECSDPKKVRFSEDGDYVFLTSPGSKASLWFHQFGQPGFGKLKAGEVDEIRAASGGMVVTSGARLSFFDFATSKLTRHFDVERQLVPRGRRPEDVHVGADGAFVFSSIQKDNRRGTKFGSRLNILRADNFHLVSDLWMPRSLPEAHIKADPREHGPGPEVVLTSSKSNILFATSDLYGAVLLTDLDAAMKGELKNTTYLPTSLDGSWGNSFPDRALLFTMQGKEYFVVTNVGPGGGAILIDAATRKVVRQWEVPPGLETPVYLPSQNKLVAAGLGKLKERKPYQTLGRDFQDGNLYVFDFNKLQQGVKGSMATSNRQGVVRVADLPGEVIWVSGFNSTSSPYVAVGLHNPADNTDHVSILDTRNMQIVSSVPAVGSVSRMEGY